MAQDNYVGDIGDFANNGLLRYLCGLNSAPLKDQRLVLGVVWYRNKGNPRSPDGNRINYLNVSESNASLYRECDKELYDTLQKLVGKSLVNGKKRDIQQLIQSSILPNDTQHYLACMNANDRGEWFKDALKKTAGAELIFINPDTGLDLEIDKGKREVVLEEETTSVKHTSLSELRAFVKKKKSLVIYQHAVRDSDWASDLAMDIATKLKKLTANCQLGVWALQWNREQSRTYFVVAQPNHTQVLDSRIKALLNNTPWNKKPRGKKKKSHFTLLGNL